jgi:cytochrome P450
MISLDEITVEELEEDPYPVYARLRREAPVAYAPALDVWMVTRWHDVNEACGDPERFPARVERSPTDRALGGISMMTIDGEPAKQRRRPYDSSLRPRAVEASMPGVFQELCRRYLDRIADHGEAELIADYFEPISLVSLAHLMGIDDLVDVPVLRRWFAGLAAGVSNYEDDPAKSRFCLDVNHEIEDVLRPRFALLMAEPDGGMLSNLLHAASGSFDERLEWLMPSLKLVLLGGLQEPAHGGATIADCLLAHPDQLAEVRDDPSLVVAGVEEGLRWTAPIGNLLRGATSDSELSGVPIPAGDRVILIVSSANRDGEVWGPDADSFDIHRPKRAHLSFATGPHYCIGHHFARVQLRVAINELIKRFPDLRRLTDDPTVYRGHEYRSPTAVRVAVG